MVAQYVLPAALMAASTLGSVFGKKNTVEEPKEIGQARKLLLEYGSTGKMGDYQAGEDIGIGYGNYDMSGLEKQGQSALSGLLSSGIPDQFKLGDSALQDLLQTSPDAIEKQFQPFSTITDRTTQEALNAQKRSAAYAGGLYSSRTIKGLGDINAKANETKMSKMAELMDAYQNRKLSAIPLAYQSGTAQENILQNRIAASQQYGGLARQLNNASVAERNAEILRRREERGSAVSAMTSVLNGQYQTPVSQSPYAALLGTLGQIGGQYLYNSMNNNGSTGSTSSGYGSTYLPQSLSLYNNNQYGYSRYMNS